MEPIMWKLRISETSFRRRKAWEWKRKCEQECEFLGFYVKIYITEFEANLLNYDAVVKFLSLFNYHTSVEYAS